MKFTVVWTPAVERDLAELWLEYPTWRTEISQAANEVDSFLRRDPEKHGESRFENVRFCFWSPLAVDYRVFPDDLRVEIIGITFAP